MAERTYTTVDKSAWGDGHWQNEPDKIQFVDEATGLDCLVVRGPSGALCGYVGVPPEHPWHGIDYSEPVTGDEDDYGSRPDCKVRVHGGLTFAGGCNDEGDEATSICHVPEPGRPADVWWFGFDCAHLGDRTPGRDARLGEDLYPPPYGPVYRTVEYVRAECAVLAEQLAAVAHAPAGRPLRVRSGD